MDECINRLGIRHAEQRFDERHEGDTLVGGEGAFGEEALHQAEAIAGADGFDQLLRKGGDGAAVGFGKTGIGDQIATSWVSSARLRARIDWRAVAMLDTGGGLRTP